MFLYNNYRHPHSSFREIIQALTDYNLAKMDTDRDEGESSDDEARNLYVSFDTVFEGVYDSGSQTWSS
jgi:hypothetical protein